MRAPGGGPKPAVEHNPMRLVLCLLGTLCLSARAAGLTAATPTEYFGTCSASAGAFLDAAHFVAASDEDSVLRVYRVGASQPVATLDLSGFLALDRQRPEADLEGAARAGDRIWWIGSHSRTAEGKRAPNRQCLFATRLAPAPAGPPGLEPLGRPYRRLLDDLLAAPSLQSVPLAGAAALAPEAGGVNIEGLAAAPDGPVWIGFRSPVPAGRALLVPLLNPEAILRGERAQLGEPARLDLSGLGVRDLLWAGGRCWILAGPADGGGSFRLYVWEGPGRGVRAVPWAGALPRRFRPEALLAPVPERASASENPARFLVLSDDGGRRIDDCICQELPDPAQRRFRAMWMPGSIP